MPPFFMSDKDVVMGYPRIHGHSYLLFEEYSDLYPFHFAGRRMNVEHNLIKR